VVGGCIRVQAMLRQLALTPSSRSDDMRSVGNER
jgi:hypothetical protein